MISDFERTLVKFSELTFPATTTSTPTTPTPQTEAQRVASRGQQWITEDSENENGPERHQMRRSGPR